MSIYLSLSPGLQPLKRKRVTCPFLDGLSLLIRKLGGLGVEGGAQGEAAYMHITGTQV